MHIINMLITSFPKVPVGKTGKSVDVDWSVMDVDTIAALAWHGLKQKANDSNAGAAKAGTSEKDMIENVRAVVARHEANELAATRESDPVARELTKLATEHTAKFFRGKKPTPAEFTAKKNEYRGNAKLKELAQKLADMKAEAEIELDI